MKLIKYNLIFCIEKAEKLGFEVVMTSFIRSGFYVKSCKKVALLLYIYFSRMRELEGLLRLAYCDLQTLRIIDYEMR